MLIDSDVVATTCKYGGGYVPDLRMHSMQDVRQGDQERGVHRLRQAIRNVHLQEGKIGNPEPLRGVYLFHLFLMLLGRGQTSSSSASSAVSGSIFSHFVGEVYFRYSPFIEK